MNFFASEFLNYYLVSFRKIALNLSINLMTVVVMLQLYATAEFVFLLGSGN